MNSKRKLSESNEDITIVNKKSKNLDNLDNDSSTKPVCQYGKECYRKNPDHLKEYHHPGIQN